MAIFRNKNTGKEVRWDESRGELTKFWVKVEEEPQEKPLEKAVAEKQNIPVEEVETKAENGELSFEDLEDAIGDTNLAEGNDNTFSNWNELRKKANKDEVAFLEDGRAYEYDRGWKTAEGLEKPVEEPEEAPQEIDWSE